MGYILSRWRPGNEKESVTMIKKILMMCICSAMLVTLAVGCSGKKSDSASQDNEQPKVKDTVVEATADVTNLKMFGFKTGAEEGAIPELVEAFNTMHPEILVTYEGISNAGGYSDILKTRLASGQGDDLFFANPSYIEQLLQAGYVVDLKDLDVIDEYSPMVQDLMTINGSIPGLAMEVAVYGVYSNVDLLNEVGIDEVPDTYEAFLYACEKLVDAGKTPFVAASKKGTGMGIFALPKALEPIYTSDEKMSLIGDINNGNVKFGDIMRPGFDLVKNLIDKGYVDGELALASEGQDDMSAFVKGDIGFMPGGSWYAAKIEKVAPNMNFVLGSIPVEDDSSNVMVNAGVRVCVNKNLEHVDESLKFLEFFTSLESINAYVDSQNSFSPLSNGKSSSKDIVAIAAEKISEGKMIPWVDSAFKTTVVSPWDDATKFGAYIAGGATVDKAVEELNRQIENNIKLN